MPFCFHRSLLAPLFVATLFVAGLISPLQARCGERIHAVTGALPPMSYLKDGEAGGFVVDLVREGLRRMDASVHIEFLPWKRALLMTQEGQADAIFYAVKNSERETYLVFPDEPLLTEATVLLKRSGERIAVTPDGADFERYRLGVGRGFYYGPKLTAFLETARFAAIEEATYTRTNLRKLIGGRIDIAFVDFNLARHLLESGEYQDKLDIVADASGQPLIFDSVDSYLAFSRGPNAADRAQRFSEALRSMKADGVYDRIVAARP